MGQFSLCPCFTRSKLFFLCEQTNSSWSCSCVGAEWTWIAPAQSSRRSAWRAPATTTSSSIAPSASLRSMTPASSCEFYPFPQHLLDHHHISCRSHPYPSASSLHWVNPDPGWSALPKLLRVSPSAILT